MKNYSPIPSIFFLFTFILTAYFYSPNLSNQNSRLDAIYSAVELQNNPAPLSIDRFIFNAEKDQNTIDWSYYDGHYYSNKAPGGILIGVIIYKLIYETEQMLGFNHTDPIVAHFNAYFINLFTSVLPFAFAISCFYLLLLRLKTSLTYSVLITTGLLLCTPLIAYNTHLWGNTTSTSFLILCIYYLFLNKSLKQSLLCGVFFSVFACSEYLTGISAFFIIIYGLFARRFNILFFILGALPFSCATMLYHYICFDSPFGLTTFFNNSEFTNQELSLGIFGSFNLEVLFMLLFSFKRGIFIATPVLLLSLIGTYWWLKKNHKDLFLWFIILNILGYLIAISCFNGWHGGSTAYSRYLLPILPFFFILLIKIPTQRNLILNLLTYFFIIISTLNAVVMCSISPLAPDDHPSPLYEYLYPLFLEGKISPYKFPIRIQALDLEWESYKEWSSWNLGQLIGLEGIYSLLPFFLMIIVMIMLLELAIRNKKGRQ